MPNAINYRLKKTLLGKRAVEYACPFCATALESPLEEAGTVQPCPSCAKGVRTPGEGDLRNFQQEHAEKVQRAEREKAERQRQAEERIAAANQQAIEEQRLADHQLLANFDPHPYTGLQIAGGVLRVLAILYYVLAAMALGGGIIMILTSLNPNSWIIGAPYIGSSIGLAMIGAIMHGASAACEALRDIARNSWKEKSGA